MNGGGAEEQGSMGAVTRRRGDTATRRNSHRVGTLTVFGVILLASLPASGGAGAQQQAKVPRIGYLAPRSEPNERDEAFRQGLRELGYVEGKNIVMEYRWAGERDDRLPDLAAELVALKVDVIVTSGGPAARAAKQATSMIPIVMAAVGDPVATGLVASLARPGGNITGQTIFSSELAGKRLELLKEVVPRVTHVAVLAYRPSPVTKHFLSETEAAARVLRVQLHSVEVRGPNELEGAFAEMVKERAGGLVVQITPLFFDYRRKIVDLAAKSRLPAIYETREFVDAGGLVSYGPNRLVVYRRAATYVDKIVKGAKPADLPVEQPTRFELVVNLKTAKALGLTIPPSIMVRADQVIR